MKYRFKMYKGDEVKFIGHLDLLVSFQRAIKRAGLPIDYSQGFNPHQMVSFAAPLSLGLTSCAEYGDFQLKEDMSADFVKEKLNENMPEGLKILSLIRLKDGVKNTMTLLQRAEYELYFDKNVTPQDVEKNLDLFMEQKEIRVMKKTKKGINEADIKPDIFEIANISHDGMAVLKMQVSSGSVRNLKPESIAEGFCSFINKPFDKFAIKSKRTGMFTADENGYFVALDYGVER